MEEAIKYKNVIREYFLEYKNRDQVLKSIFYVILFGASFSPLVFGSAKEGLGIYGSHFRWLLRCFAAITHTSALPTMMYLVPGSKKLREEYIRRMLKVKIGLPLALCAVIDINPADRAADDDKRRDPAAGNGVLYVLLCGNYKRRTGLAE